MVGGVYGATLVGVMFKNEAPDFFSAAAALLSQTEICGNAEIYIKMQNENLRCMTQMI